MRSIIGRSLLSTSNRLLVKSLQPASHLPYRSFTNSTIPTVPIKNKHKVDNSTEKKIIYDVSKTLVFKEKEITLSENDLQRILNKHGLTFKFIKTEKEKSWNELNSIEKILYTVGADSGRSARYK